MTTRTRRRKTNAKKGVATENDCQRNQTCLQSFVQKVSANTDSFSPSSTGFGKSLVTMSGHLRFGTTTGALPLGNKHRDWCLLTYK